LIYKAILPLVVKAHITCPFSLFWAIR